MSFFGPSAHRQKEILTTIQLLLTRALQSVSVGISGGPYVEKDTQTWYRMISLVSYVPQLGWPCDMYRAWHALISGLLPVSYFVLYALNGRLHSPAVIGHFVNYQSVWCCFDRYMSSGWRSNVCETLRPMWIKCRLSIWLVKADQSLISFGEGDEWLSVAILCVCSYRVL